LKRTFIPKPFPYSSGNGSSEPVVDELLTTVAEFRVGASEADLWLLSVTRGKGRMRVTSAHRFGTSQPRHVTGSVKRLFAPHETLGEFVENTVCIDGEQDAYQRLSRGATLAW